MQTNQSTIFRLKKLPILFRSHDVEKLVPHTGVFLSRAQKKGYIRQLTKGNYINSFLYGEPSIERIGCFLKPPSYISCEWALNHWGITLQVPFVCTVITLHNAVGRLRRFDYRGIFFEFSKIKGTLFNGFEYLNGFYLAQPEKAILDTLYFRGSIPAADELEMDDVDKDKLLTYAKQYPKTVRKKLLSLLDA